MTIHAGAAEDSIECTISCSSLDDTSREPYECLSYCWGDRKDPRFVRVWSDSTVDAASVDCMMPVTANLYDALREIRDVGYPRTMWIDVLCIHLDDLVERSEQVALMRDIYAQAKGVIVWLGKGDPAVVKSIQDAFNILHRYQSSTAEAVDTLGATKLHAPLLDDGFYHVDSDFFSCEWFHRVWVLQVDACSSALGKAYHASDIRGVVLRRPRGVEPRTAYVFEASSQARHFGCSLEGP